MATDWRMVTVDAIKAPTPNSIAMGPFGSNIKTDNFVSSGVPVIRGVNLASGRFHDADFVFLTEEKADQLRSANAFPLDLVFTHRGTLGQVGIIPKDAKHSRYVISQSQMKLTCDKYKVDPMFLFYFFRSPAGQYALLANTSTTGVPAISRPLTSLRSIRVPLPSIGEQTGIASILGSLDDKIELNHRMNETLEAIAQALFKSWFVDFDPVRAKAEGREPYGVDSETAALFPDAFEDSELGLIPRGWGIGPLSSRIEILSGGTPKTSVAEYWNGSVSWVSVVDTSPGPYITRTEKTVTQLGVQNSATKILPRETIVLTARGTVGNCALMAEPMAMNQSCYGLRGQPGVGQLFLFHQVKEQVNRLRRASHGSVFSTITRQTFDTLRVVWQPTECIAAFDTKVRPLFDRILLNQRESLTLAAIRDTLLPKLMSGEIRGQEAEKLVEARV